MDFDLIKVIFIAIGGMIGGGIFILNGYSVYNLGYNSIYQWIIGFIITALICFSFIILNLKYTNDSGALNFISHLIKNNGIKTSIMIIILISYITITSVYTMSASEYICKYFNSEYYKVIGSFIIAICLLLNNFPDKIFNNIIVGFVFVKLILLISIIVIGLILPSNNNNNNNNNIIQNINPSSQVALFPILGSIFFYSITSFLTYEGFEFISNHSHKLKNKQFRIPLAYIISILIVATVYIGLAFVTKKHIFNLLNKQNYFSSFLILVESYGLKKYGSLIIVMIVILANLSAINATYSTIDMFVEKFFKSLKNKIIKKINRKVKLPFFKNERSVFIYIFSILIILFLFLPKIFLTNMSSLLFLLFFSFISFIGIKYTYYTKKQKEIITIFNRQIPFSLSYLIQFLMITISIISIITIGYSNIKLFIR